MSDDPRAAEYVLGTLDAAERAEFARAMAQDEDARAAVAAWEKRLAPLGAAVGEIAPPEAVWTRVEAALEGPRAPASLAVVEGGLADHGELPALRASVDRWRGFFLAASALAAALAILVVSREIAPPAPPSYLAVVNRGGDQPALIIRVDLASGAVFVRPVAAQAPAGKSLELWYIGAGKAPKSMGLVERDPLKMALPAGLSAEKATFAVTVEPKGGSPTGDPTGPVVYSGQLIRE